ncbi:hypothetical protein BH11PLA2_BH11PLA2_20000 [soil metagenome]
MFSSSPRKRKSPLSKPVFRLEALEEREQPAVLFATVTPEGTAAQVIVKDATTWSTLFTINPFNGFTGGIQTALADANGDGTDDIIVAAGPSGSTNLEIYNGTTGALLRTQSISDKVTGSGVSIAAAGKNASGQALLAVGANIDNTATMEIINLSTQATVTSLLPFGNYDGPLTIAAADVNADSVADIIVGAGKGGGPRLAVINGATGARLYDGFMYETFFNGGIHVSVGDLTADNKPEIVIGAGVTGGPRVRVLNTTTWTTTQDFFAYDSSQRDGVTPTVFKSTVDGTAKIVTSPGKNTDAIISFDPSTLSQTSVSGYTGYPVGPIATTTTGPTLSPPVSPPPTSPPLSLADDSGMVSITSMPNPNDPNWVTRASGLKVWDTYTGTGTPDVTSASTITVYYTGWTVSNGVKFDAARSPSSPATFPLSNLIAGWKEGLIGMKPGGVRRLFIPSALGYGAAGSGSSIPPNSDLIFEIKLTATT